MKEKITHIVPLARQAVEVLDQLKRFNGHGDYIFPSIRGRDRTISENTLNVTMHQLGVEKGTTVPHVFRSMASTLLNQMGWNKDWIERQLAHMEGTVRATYNSADFLPQRKIMMQAYADYLDRLRTNTSGVEPDLITPGSLGL